MLQIAILLWGLGAISSLTPRAADTPESDQAFSAAGKAFRDEFWDRADQQLAAFVAKYPESSHVSEAVLLQAQSRFQSKRYDAVVDLLTEKLDAAGAQSDQYRYWIAEAQFQRENFDASAKAYADLLKQSPDSPLGLKAGFG